MYVYIYTCLYVRGVRGPWQRAAQRRAKRSQAERRARSPVCVASTKSVCGERHI